jgi:signal transduction histidine kinase
MDTMVLDILELSQLESGVKLILQKHSLNQIAEQVLERYQDVITKKNISASIVATEDCVVECGNKWIEQVLSNFLSNAVRHTPESGRIDVSITNDDGRTVFSIENSGEHIPPDKIDHIWDAFYKTDMARSNPEGTGLGLSIVKKILIAHGFCDYGVENTTSGVKFWFAVNKQYLR